MTASFDPANHRRLESRWFDDFRVGEKFVLPSRTMTDALFLAFQSASRDNHPVHYDVEYCRRRGMPHMLAHGYQVLPKKRRRSEVSACLMPSAGTILI